MKLIKAHINRLRPHSRNVMPGAIEKYVGPFIYFDHLGPFDFAAYREVYIPPHPHAGIATVSYMFSGEGNHRDSLGNEQVLHAGRVNYMNAGNGIIHSEGLSNEFSQTGGRLLGVQIWHLLSANERNSTPKFQTYSKIELGNIPLNETFKAVLIIGNYSNVFSPVKTEREMLMMAIEANGNGNATIDLKKNWQYLLYTCDGSVTIDGNILLTGEGVFLENNGTVKIHVTNNTRAILMGGPALQEEPVFAGSLVAVGTEQMEFYQQRFSTGSFGTFN